MRLDLHPKRAQSRKRILGPTQCIVDNQPRDLHCASMLALFKPWRKIQDLLPEGSTGEVQFQEFTSQANKSYLRIIEHIQYNFRSKDAADEERNDSPKVALKPSEADFENEGFNEVEKRRGLEDTTSEPSDIKIWMASENQHH